MLSGGININNSKWQVSHIFCHVQIIYKNNQVMYVYTGLAIDNTPKIKVHEFDGQMSWKLHINTATDSVPVY